MCCCVKIPVSKRKNKRAQHAQHAFKDARIHPRTQQSCTRTRDNATNTQFKFPQDKTRQDKTKTRQYTTRQDNTREDGNILTFKSAQLRSACLLTVTNSWLQTREVRLVVHKTRKLIGKLRGKRTRPHAPTHTPTHAHRCTCTPTQQHTETNNKQQTTHRKTTDTKNKTSRRRPSLHRWSAARAPAARSTLTLVDAKKRCVRNAGVSFQTSTTARTQNIAQHIT